MSPFNFVEEAMIGRSVFRNESSLFPEYVPQELPCREEEIKRLAQNFRILIEDEGSFSVNVAIVGQAGVGKTALCKYTMERVEEIANQRNRAVKFVYYNCHSFRSKTAILRNILTEHFGIRSRGFSDEEILEMLVKRLSKEGIRLIIALDEANMLDSQDILSIFHAGEYFGSKHSMISTIIISRPVEWSSLLNVPLSGHIHDQMDIQGYTREEILEILKYRAEIALYETAYSEETLQLIADISSSSRNARHGLEILYRAGKIADRKREKFIKPDYIRAAKADVYPELRRDVFKELKEQELVAALGVGRSLRVEGVTATTIDEAYEYYIVACEEFNIEAKSKSTFRSSIEILNKVGILSKSVGPIETGKRGRRAKITTYDIPVSVLIERIENILKQKTM
ncbi:MAG: AAA family ATPase [Candidatus Heimdallarchaeum aukensis]|uniref:ORC1-type DNA replication protein n=1 Tax=Candidatus Heimdallarchaeum aukensis TaxID=2876573 RepID=A0A9Y1BMF2_9ARCH|nr:MAG: AAA family ATPase [Candidatus Heimdallarchaeum aukensis]